MRGASAHGRLLWNADAHESLDPSGDPGRVVRAKDVLGAHVSNRHGELLGSLEDLVFEVASGRIAYAVLSFGGFLGVGDKLFALPWRSLEWDASRHDFILDIPHEQLEQAPGFDPRHWPDLSDREWQINVYNFYGLRPYWEEGEERRRAA